MLAELMLEYGWTLNQTLDQVEPAHVGFLLDQARQRWKRHQLDLLYLIHPKDPKEAEKQLKDQAGFMSAAPAPATDEVKADFNEGLIKLAQATNRPDLVKKVQQVMDLNRVKARALELIAKMKGQEHA